MTDFVKYWAGANAGERRATAKARATTIATTRATAGPSIPFAALRSLWMTDFVKYWAGANAGERRATAKARATTIATTIATTRATAGPSTHHPRTEKRSGPLSLRMTSFLKLTESADTNGEDRVLLHLCYDTAFPRR
jgi:hypothetical protein